MKGFIKLFFIFVAIFKIESHTIASGENPLLDRLHTKCSHRAQHQPKLMQKFFEGQLPEQELSEIADYIYCVFRELGYMEEDGKLNIDVIIKKYNELLGPKNPDLKKYVKCLEIKNKNLKKMVSELYRCTYDLRYKCHSAIGIKLEELERSN